MANQVLPITQLDQVGLILDTPPASLPPNAFSDVNNIRFKDGSVKKMEGEVNIFPNLFDDTTNQINGLSANFDGSIIKYCAWWPNPNLINNNKGYYLVIAEETRSAQQKDIAYIVSVDGANKIEKGIFTATPLGDWQHTFFQGGFCLIINNGLDVPHYILDEENNTNINNVPSFSELPGWDSYEVNQIYLQDIFDSDTDSFLFDLGKQVNFELEYIEVIDYDSGTDTYTTFTANGSDGDGDAANSANYDAPLFSTFTGDPTVGFGTNDNYQIFYNDVTNSHIIFLPSNLDHGNHEDRLTISIRSRNEVKVRCGVLRSFGDFLVAGNLVERNLSDLDSPVVRNLNSVIRTSDVAAPASVPNNWNPFAAGVSTADEFVVADSGVVQDMVELQGGLYIYTNNSISVMKLTGNASVPLSITPVTDNHGCQTTGAVVEFNGKHFVVGSQDIYIFGGHPGTIESLADQRVRNAFFQDLNPLHSNRMFALQYSQMDEIWLCYPSRSSITGDCDKALIFNYRTNVWSKRELRGVISGDIAPVPGGGLPLTDVTLNNTSGTNGVTNVGAYEVRTIGIDNTQYFNGDKTFYIGGNSELIYGTGRNGNNTRVETNGERDFYEFTIFPEVQLTGPESINETFRLTNPNSSQYTNVNSSQIIDQIASKITSINGWSSSSLPTGYTQLTDGNRLVSTVDGTNITGLRKVTDTVPFAISITDQGNTLTGSVLDLDFQESTNVSSVHHLTKSDANDYRGEYVLRATPTYLALLVRNPAQPGDKELIIVEAGSQGTYDVANHNNSATNGVTGGTNEETAEAWINNLKLATFGLTIKDTGTNGEFSIQPSNFSDLADFVLDVRINDTQANADWIWARYLETVAGTIGLNSNSVVPFTNGVDQLGTKALAVHSTAPAPAGSGDTQLSPDSSRVPNRTTTETTATMSATININNIFNVDRPWDKSEVNTNLEYPIFSSKQSVNEGGSSYNINKVIGADIGWTVPTYAYNPRTETEDTQNYQIVITNNDAPKSYESYVERKQLAINPEFTTDTIKRIALWAEGEYQPYVDSVDNYNRLQLRFLGTNNPGHSSDLSTISDTTKKNTFFISEDYKVDTRVNGRYLNYRITDKVLSNTNVELSETSNPKNDRGVVYNQNTSWALSGMQPEISTGGGR